MGMAICVFLALVPLLYIVPDRTDPILGEEDSGRQQDYDGLGGGGV